AERNVRRWSSRGWKTFTHIPQMFNGLECGIYHITVDAKYLLFPSRQTNWYNAGAQEQQHENVHEAKYHSLRSPPDYGILCCIVPHYPRLDSSMLCLSEARIVYHCPCAVFTLRVQK